MKIDFKKETKPGTYLLTFSNLNFLREESQKSRISMSKLLNKIIEEHINNKR